MYIWPEIATELKGLEIRVDEKLDKIISNSSNPFPFDRLKKGKQIIALCRGIRLLIEKDLEKDAETLLQLLLEMGIKLKSFR